MSGVLRDSIDARVIPHDNLVAVAGYGDGIYQWSPSWWDGSNGFDLFEPSIVRLVIVVNALHQGDILDVEQGDATPPESIGWVQRFKRPARRAPSLYVNRGTWPAVVGALDSAGIDPSRIDWWIATLDGTLDVYFGQPGVPVPPGFKVVAVQWKGSKQTGANYDESVILDPTWIGGAEVLDPNDPVVKQILAALVPGRNPDGSFTSWLDQGVSDVYHLIADGLAAQGSPNAAQTSLEARVVVPALTYPQPIDLNALIAGLAGPLAAALNTHPITASLSEADKADIASHVMGRLAVQFNKP